MKYKLINKQTGKEHLCDKVTIDGFDYYVSEEKINSSNYEDYNFWFYNPYIKELQISCNPNSCHKVIATNNPNIDTYKVVDEVERLANWATEETQSSRMKRVWKSGYNKSQETHPFSEEDMIEFAQHSIRFKEIHKYVDVKELLQLWKEQQPKKVYYEKEYLGY